MNYEKDIRIDETSLDIEWLDQPMLMIKYAKIAALARKDLDEAKESLDIVKAGLDKDIRMHPEDFEIEKITETVVQNTILLEERYQEANKAMIEAKYEADIAQSAVRAIDQRKDALENLVRLHGQQYFAGPKIPRDLTFEAKKKHEQGKVNDIIGMKRKTK